MKNATIDFGMKSAVKIILGDDIKITSKHKKLTAISLFSGAGGMDVGFSKAGFNILWANDFNKDACETFEANHGSIIQYGKIEDYIDTLDQYKGVDIVFGGPPCQGFSVAGKMNPEDERSNLVFAFMDVVEKIQPKAFVMENVKALGALEKWASVREKLFKRAKDLGYKFTQIIILNASEYGVPQKRERMFFIGLKDPTVISNAGLESYFEKHKKKGPKVGEIIKKLGRAGSPTNPKTCNAKITTATKPILRRSPYAGMMFNGAGRPIDPNDYSNTLPASMGGNKTPFVDEAQIFDGKKSWVEKYHKTLWEDGAAPLDFQQAPSFLRRITLNEAIAIQTFPEDYSFKGGTNSIYKQIGNAVPCELAHVVATVVREFLES